MAVPTETIIKKMIEQLTKALQQSEQKDVVKKHIEQVQLLCELVVDTNESDEESTSTSVQDVIEGPVQQQTYPVLEEDEDGTSIFDF